MAYDKLEQEQKALDAIKKHNLIFIEDVISFLDIASSTFYLWKMEELETIKRALSKNKINIKVSLREEWRKSKNPITQITLYKLASTKEEQDLLSMKTIEKVVTPAKEWDLSKLDIEELEILEKLKAKMQKQNE